MVKFHAQSVLIAHEYALINDLMKAPAPLSTLVKPRGAKLHTLTKEKIHVSLKMDEVGTLDSKISIQVRNPRKLFTRAIDMGLDSVVSSLLVYVSPDRCQAGVCLNQPTLGQTPLHWHPFIFVPQKMKYKKPILVKRSAIS